MEKVYVDVNVNCASKHHRKCPIINKKARSFEFPSLEEADFFQDPREFTDQSVGYSGLTWIMF